MASCYFARFGKARAVLEEPDQRPDDPLPHELLEEQTVLSAQRTTSSTWQLLRIEPNQDADDVTNFTRIADMSGVPFTNITHVGDVANNGSVVFRIEGPPVESTFVGNGVGNIHGPNSFRRPFPAPRFGEGDPNIAPGMNSHEQQ